MEVAPPVCRAADRLGLELDVDGDTLGLRRHDWRTALRAPQLFAPDRDRVDHHRAAWVLQGVRLGLDCRADPEEDDPYEAPRHRRASIRRYHEAPSVHGDHLPLLVPRITRRIFETVADATAFRRPWLTEDLEVLVVEETGIRIQVLTERRQDESELSDDKRWDKVRSALFYQSYKVRPDEVREVDGGELRIIQTREGFGATRATLLPEFDYDASRAHGYLAVPSRDRIVVARPEREETNKRMLPALEALVDESVADSDFGLTDALFQLEPEDLSVLRTPSPRRLAVSGRSAVELVTDVAPP